MKKILLITPIIILLSITLAYGHFAFITYIVDALIFPPAEKIVTLSDGYQATYYKLVTGNGDPANAIFFVPGSGYFSLRYYLRFYFRYLPENYAVYALQKRHVSSLAAKQFSDPPEKFQADNYFGRWTADQTDFVSKIITGEGHKYSDFVIFGVSEGGNVAAHIAASVKYITHLAVIGSGGYKQADELKTLFKGTDLGGDYEKIAKDSQSVKLTFLGQTYKYWNSVLHVDPMKYYAVIDIPTLVAMGEKDASAPIESGRFLKDRIEKINRKNFTFVEYGDSNHSLVAPDGTDNKKDFFERLDKMVNSQKTPAH